MPDDLRTTSMEAELLGWERVLEAQGLTVLPRGAYDTEHGWIGVSGPLTGYLYRFNVAELEECRDVAGLVNSHEARLMLAGWNDLKDTWRLECEIENTSDRRFYDWFAVNRYTGERKQLDVSYCRPDVSYHEMLLHAALDFPTRYYFGSMGPLDRETLEAALFYPETAEGETRCRN